MVILSNVAFEALQERIRVLEKVNESLISQIVEMKRDGFARPTPQMAQEVEKPALDDRIMAAIRAMAPEGSRLESELVHFANAALLAEEEIEDIADRILAGSTFGDD